MGRLVVRCKRFGEQNGAWAHATRARRVQAGADRILTSTCRKLIGLGLEGAHAHGVQVHYCGKADQRSWHASIARLPTGVSRQRLVVLRSLLSCPLTLNQNVLQRCAGFAKRGTSCSRSKRTFTIGAVGDALASSRSRGPRPLREAMSDAVHGTAAHQNERKRSIALRQSPSL